MLKLIFSLSTLWWMILFLYIPACFGLIIIVLLQRGKGQGLAGAFGMGGGMDTIFGPRSSKSLPQKITYASAAIFMSLALIMSILSGKVGRPAAPELASETPKPTFEALFDSEDITNPPYSPAEAVNTEAATSEESEDVETEEEDASAESPAPSPPPLDDVLGVAPEDSDSEVEQDAESATDAAEAAATVLSEETAATGDNVAAETENTEEDIITEDAPEEDVAETPVTDAPAE
ncbi:MAG TPA: preprotein translocase subunit SecG [Candidatus Hydrogenedentes bacterium]|nr:preprotein translocase subunit SecG [Candidatus Hydrogenedentota bacterium]